MTSDLMSTGSLHSLSEGLAFVPLRSPVSWMELNGGTI